MGQYNDYARSLRQGANPFDALGNGLYAIQQSKLNHETNLAELGLRKQGLEQQDSQFDKDLGFRKEVHSNEMGLRRDVFGEESRHNKVVEGQTDQRIKNERALAEAQARRIDAEARGINLESDRYQEDTARGARRYTIEGFNNIDGQLMGEGIDISTPEGRKAARENERYMGQIRDTVLSSIKYEGLSLGARTTFEEPILDGDSNPTGKYRFVMQTENGLKYYGADGSKENAVVYDDDMLFAIFNRGVGLTKGKELEAAFNIEAPITPGETVAAFLQNQMKQAAVADLNNPEQVGAATQQRIQESKGAVDREARNTARELTKGNALELISQRQQGDAFTKSSFFDNRFEVFAPERKADETDEVYKDRIADNVTDFFEEFKSSGKMLRLLKKLGLDAPNRQAARQYLADSTREQEIMAAVLDEYGNMTRATNKLGGLFNDLGKSDKIPLPNEKQLDAIAKRIGTIN